MRRIFLKILAISAVIFLCGLGFMAWISPYPFISKLHAIEMGINPFTEKLLFPIGTFEPNRLESDYFDNLWYSQNLIRINEDSFPNYSPNQTLFRLTVVPSSTNAYAFRLIKKDDAYTLLFKVVGGGLIYDPILLQQHQKTPLEKYEADILINAFQKINTCTIPKNDIFGFHGSQWLFESYEKDANSGYKYCFANYWSPDASEDETRKSMVKLRTLLVAKVPIFMTDEEIYQKVFEEAQKSEESQNEN